MVLYIFFLSIFFIKIFKRLKINAATSKINDKKVFNCKTKLVLYSNKSVLVVIDFIFKD